MNKININVGSHNTGNVAGRDINFNLTKYCLSCNAPMSIEHYDRYPHCNPCIEDIRTIVKRRQYKKSLTFMFLTFFVYINYCFFYDKFPTFAKHYISLSYNESKLLKMIGLTDTSLIIMYSLVFIFAVLLIITTVISKLYSIYHVNKYYPFHKK